MPRGPKIEETPTALLDKARAALENVMADGKASAASKVAAARAVLEFFRDAGSAERPSPAGMAEAEIEREIEALSSAKTSARDPEP